MYFYISRGVHVFDLRAGHCQLTASTVGKFAHMTVYLSMCNIPSCTYYMYSNIARRTCDIGLIR